MRKVCSACGEEKPAEDFPKHRYRKDGLGDLCRSCVSDRNRKYYESRKDELIARRRQYVESNRQKVTECNRKYARENRQKRAEKAREYRASHPREISERNRKYVEKNKSKLLQKHKEYQRDRKKTDPLFKLAQQIRTRLYMAVSTGGKARKPKTEQLLGCTFQDLLAHLGPKPCENAHIDHVCPCAQSRTEEELLKLQHYSNLRWLPAEENLRKSDSRTPEAEDLCRKLLDRDWID